MPLSRLRLAARSSLWQLPAAVRRSLALNVGGRFEVW